MATRIACDGCGKTLVHTKSHTALSTDGESRQCIDLPGERWDVCKACLTACKLAIQQTLAIAGNSIGRADNTLVGRPANKHAQGCALGAYHNGPCCDAEGLPILVRA